MTALLNKLDHYRNYTHSMKVNSEMFESKLVHIIEMWYKTAEDEIPETEREYIKLVFNDIEKFYGLNKRG